MIRTSLDQNWSLIHVLQHIDTFGLNRGAECYV